MNTWHVAEDKYVPNAGSAPSSHVASCQMLMLMSNWGARKMRKTMQSRYDIWLSIMVSSEARNERQVLRS